MSRKRCKCITVVRLELGTNIVDPYLRLNKFYDVVNESVPGPMSHIHDWIEVRCPITHESHTRPRYMFGPILSDTTTSGNSDS